MPNRAEQPEVEIVDVESLTFDDHNTNRHNEGGMNLLGTSLNRNKFGRSILIDKNGKVIAGNATLEKAKEAGFTKVAIIKSKGKVLIAHQREDLDLDRDVAAKELAVADNRIAEHNLEWDGRVLEEMMRDGVELTEAGFTAEEIAKLIDNADGPNEADQQQPSLESKFLILITCANEVQQAELLQRFIDEGLDCKAMGT